MNTQILEHCVAGSLAGTMSFPENVRLLLEEGVEWYSANLVFGMTTHYAADLSHHQIRWTDFETPAIAERFDADAVLAAIRASQAGQIKYREFLRRIAQAGTVYYTVHLQGRRAGYFGRHGEFHIENFPAAT